MTGRNNTNVTAMDEDLNDIAAADDILRTGETPRDPSFDVTETEATEAFYNELFTEAFVNDEVKSVEVSPSGTELNVETERFVAVGQLDETAESLRVLSAFVERNVEDEPYLLMELEDDAHELLSELGDARKQFYEWQRAEPSGAAALTVGERNRGLGRGR